jgi:hypothetical protein
MSSFNKAEIMPRLKQGKGARQKAKGKGQRANRSIFKTLSIGNAIS